MLILDRYNNQSLFINGTEVEITVLGVNRNGRVRLGIEAPADVSVHREELLDVLPHPSFSLADRNKEQ